MSQVPDVFFRRNQRALEFDIRDLSDLQQKGASLDPPPNTYHRIDFNLILLIESGEGKHWIDFAAHDFQSHSVVFVNQRQIQAFDFSSPLSGKIVLYTDAFLETLRERVRLPNYFEPYLSERQSPVMQVSDKVWERVERNLQELSCELAYIGESGDVLVSQFASLAMLLMRERSARSHANAQLDDNKLHDLKRYAIFQKLLDENCAESREAAFYADKMGMSYKSLNLLCKRVSNETAKSIIDRHLMLEIKRRLVIGNLDVPGIAYEMGFAEVTNFAKFFKKHSQLTPSEFRKSVRN